MPVLTRIWEIIVQMAKEVIQFPKALLNVFADRKAQGIRNDAEAERLDRIRNPEKYRGKSDN